MITIAQTRRKETKKHVAREFVDRIELTTGVMISREQIERKIISFF